MESRKIFRKLKAYVTYRFGATIQIVIVLTLLIFASNCSVNSLFVVLLALFNDITMIPIAYDLQQASATPENPDVIKLLLISLGLGSMETVASLLFAYAALPYRGYHVESNCDNKVQAAIWLQMFISAELLIFCARAPSYIVTSIRPSLSLFASVMSGNIIVSLMAYLSQDFGGLPIADILLIWAFNFLCLVFIDIAKVFIYRYFNESTAVLPDYVYIKSKHGHEEVISPIVPSLPDVESGKSSIQVEAILGMNQDEDSRLSAQSSRLGEWYERMSEASPSNISHKKDITSRGSILHQRQISQANERMSFVHYSELLAAASSPTSNVLRSSIVNTGDLRPNVPASNVGKVRINKR